MVVDDTSTESDGYSERRSGPFTEFDPEIMQSTPSNSNVFQAANTQSNVTTAEMDINPESHSTETTNTHPIDSLGSEANSQEQAEPTEMTETLEQQRLLHRGLSTPMDDETALRYRLLQALPQFSQWLQDAGNTLPSTNRDLVRTSSWNSNNVTTNTPMLFPQSQDVGGANDTDTSGENARGSASRLLEYLLESNASNQRTIRRRHSEDYDVLGTNEQTQQEEQENDTDSDQSTFEELQELLSRSYNSIPFVALLLIYFIYQHFVGITVFAFGTLLVMRLDRRLRSLIARKERAKSSRLSAVAFISLVGIGAFLALDGATNPYEHLVQKIQARSDASDSLIWEVLWTILVSDFVVRFASMILKVGIAAVKPDKMCCFWTRRASVTNEDDRNMPTPTFSSFYRRKRKLFGIIELCSILLRSLLASIPWCSYYQLGPSTLVADVFTFGYLFAKGLVLGRQGRHLLSLVRSFLTLDLEYGVYVSREEVAEAGNPDCSICYEPMRLPVKLSCNHLFCEDCVLEWFDRERSCPLCRSAMTNGENSREADFRPPYLDGSTSLIPQFL